MGVSEITVLLNQATLGDKAVLSDVYALMYREIKSIAGYQLQQLNPGQTITPTVLAHECYIKLIQAENIPLHSQKHFLNCLAKSMRLYLIDALRAKSTQKRGDLKQQDGLTSFVGEEDVAFKLIELDRWLEQVEQVDAKLAEILQYKLIFNLTFSEIAGLMDFSERQVMRLWKQGKALLLALSKNGEEVQS